MMKLTPPAPPADERIIRHVSNNEPDWDKISLQLSIGLMIVLESILGIIWMGWGFEWWIIKAMAIGFFLAFGLGYAIGAGANMWFTIVSKIPKREVREVEKMKVVEMNAAEKVLLATHSLNTRHFLRGETFNRGSSGVTQSVYNSFHQLGLALGSRNSQGYPLELDITCPILKQIDEENDEDTKEELYDKLWAFIEIQYRVSGVSVKDINNFWITNPETKSKTIFTLEKV